MTSDHERTRGTLGTHYRGTRREERALNTFIKLMRASDSVRARLEPSITRHGLTTAQFGVLETLLHLGPMNHASLATKRLVTRGNITSVVDNLERDGLVRRVQASGDRRHSLVHLTPKGRRLVKRVFPKQLDVIVDDFQVLTAKEQETLGELCRKLGRRSDEDGA